jgi:hypothetical protein
MSRDLAKAHALVLDIGVEQGHRYPSTPYSSVLNMMKRYEELLASSRRAHAAYEERADQMQPEAYGIKFFRRELWISQ